MKTLMVTLSLVCFVFAATAAQQAQQSPLSKDGVHEGIHVKVEGDKLTMTNKEGKHEHTHTVAADCEITLDGVAAKLTDLKRGNKLTVTIKDKKATVIKAESK